MSLGGDCARMGQGVQLHIEKCTAVPRTVGPKSRAGVNRSWGVESGTSEIAEVPCTQHTDFKPARF